MIVTQSSNFNQRDLQCNPKIERTLHGLRREAQRNPEENNSSASDSDLEKEVVINGN